MTDKPRRGRPAKPPAERYQPWHITLDPLTTYAVGRARQDGETDSAAIGRLIRRATMLIVSEGDVLPIERAASLSADRYGIDWIAVPAQTEADALAQAAAFDAHQHPAQTEMELFAAMYRAGTATL